MGGAQSSSMSERLAGGSNDGARAGAASKVPRTTVPPVDANVHWYVRLRDSFTATVVTVTAFLLRVVGSEFRIS